MRLSTRLSTNVVHHDAARNGCQPNLDNLDNLFLLVGDRVVKRTLWGVRGHLVVHVVQVVQGCPAQRPSLGASRVEKVQSCFN